MIRLNIVLIGMPGSGKSTVGALLACLLDRPFAETDALVERAEGRPIPELFAREGEDYFRAAETAAVRAAAALEDAVISTGGGAVLREENMAALTATGVPVFLDRPPEDLAGLEHGGRPLMAGGGERVFALYTQRIPLYRKYAQYTIQAPATPEAAAEEIIQQLRKDGLL